MSKTFGNFTFNETSIKDVYTIDVKKYGEIDATLWKHIRKLILRLQD